MIDTESDAWKIKGNGPNPQFRVGVGHGGNKGDYYSSSYPTPWMWQNSYMEEYTRMLKMPAIMSWLQKQHSTK